jgi:transcriptional regulator with XRE-family HTH domain
MTAYSLHTPEKIALQLAERLKAARLASGFKQSTLAERAGVSLGSLRRFEQTGQASLYLVLRFAFTLHRLDDFADVLDESQPRSMAELEARFKEKRKRGKI